MANVHEFDHDLMRTLWSPVEGTLPPILRDTGARSNPFDNITPLWKALKSAPNNPLPTKLMGEF